jgi:NAD+ synthase
LCLGLRPRPSVREEDERTVAVELGIDVEEAAGDLVRFITRFVDRAGASGGVLGLSGGLDSATVAFLAARALGPDRVWPFVLPYRSSSAASLEAAELVTRKLGLAATVMDITPQIDAYFREVGDQTPLRIGNKAARERMSILYDQAKAKGGLVLGTGNRTERLLGYTTLWGDMACDLAPIGALLKTQVRALAAALGVPRAIIQTVPSADLWPGQTDEGELGISYETADALLHLMVDRRLGERDIARLGYERTDIRRVRDLMRRSTHKRRLPPTPPIPEVRSRKPRSGRARRARRLD